MKDKKISDKREAENIKTSLSFFSKSDRISAANNDISVTYVEGDTIYSVNGQGEKKIVGTATKKVQIRKRVFKL